MTDASPLRLRTRIENVGRRLLRRPTVTAEIHVRWPDVDVRGIDSRKVRVSATEIKDSLEAGEPCWYDDV